MFQTPARRLVRHEPLNEPIGDPDNLQCDAGDAAPETLTALLVIPTLHGGAAEIGVVELVRMLVAAGHRPIVVSSGGRMVPMVVAAGAEFVALDVASKNPLVMVRNAVALTRLVRERGCNLIHAHGRAPAWSAYCAARRTRVPFVTTCHKGFREQNVLKRLYNSVMARGDRVIAVGDQIAELMNDRYGTPWERITVIPTSIDLDRFDPAGISRERLEAVRRAWGIEHDVKVILIVGRMLRRKGHHVMVRAAHRLKELGLKDFLCVFVGEDQGHTRYAGQLWDFVLSTNTVDVIRMPGEVDDLPAVYAAATVVVSTATQPEGLQRPILEAQAMGKPVVVSDLGAGPDLVLAPPAVPEDRMTGLRFSSGDAEALAAALVRLFSASELKRRAIGANGRAWVAAHFTASAVAEPTLRLYKELARQRRNRGTAAT